MKFKKFSIVFGSIFNLLLVFAITMIAMEQMNKPEDFALAGGIAILTILCAFQYFLIIPLFSKLFKEAFPKPTKTEE